MEAPHRLVESLADILAVLGDRDLAVARELTKLHEEFVRGTARKALEHFRAHPPLGEITLVIGGAAESERWTEAQVRSALDAGKEARPAGCGTRRGYRRPKRMEQTGCV